MISVGQERQQCAAEKQPSRQCRRTPTFFQISSRYLGCGRQIVCPAITSDNKHGVRAANARIGRVINLSGIHPPPVQFFDSFLRLLSQVFNLAKLDRLCGTRLRAGRLQTYLLPVVAECEFESAAVLLTALNKSKRA